MATGLGSFGTSAGIVKNILSNVSDLRAKKKTLRDVGITDFETQKRVFGDIETGLGQTDAEVLGRLLSGGNVSIDELNKLSDLSNRYFSGDPAFDQPSIVSQETNAKLAAGISPITNQPLATGPVPGLSFASTPRVEVAAQAGDNFSSSVQPTASTSTAQPTQRAVYLSPKGRDIGDVAYLSKEFPNATIEELGALKDLELDGDQVGWYKAYQTLKNKPVQTVQPAQPTSNAITPTPTPTSTPTPTTIATPAPTPTPTAIQPQVQNTSPVVNAPLTTPPSVPVQAAPPVNAAQAGELAALLIQQTAPQQFQQAFEKGGLDEAFRVADDINKRTDIAAPQGVDPGLVELLRQLSNSNTTLQQALYNKETEDSRLQFANAQGARDFELAQRRLQDEQLRGLLTRQDEISRQQQALTTGITNQAEQAGQQATSNLALPQFVRPEINIPFGTQEARAEAPSALRSTADEALIRLIQNPEQSPIVANQIAQLNQDAERSRQELITRLSALGNLRGAGVANERLGQFEGELLRARQGLLASGSALQYQAIQDALAAEQARSQLGLQENLAIGNVRGAPTLQAQQAQADLGLNLAQLDLAQRQYEGDYNLRRLQAGQDVANQTLQRLLTQTGVSGIQQFSESQRQALSDELYRQQTQQTAVSQADADRQLAERQAALDRLFQAQLASGNVQLGANQAPAQTLEAQRQQAELELARQQQAANERIAAQQLALQQGQLTGQIYQGANRGPTSTLEAQRQQAELELQRRALELQSQQQQFGQSATLAELTGRYGSSQTLAAQQLELQRQQLAQQQALQTAQLTGQYGNQKTLQAQELAASIEAQRQAQSLALADLLGQYGGQQTLAARQASSQTQLQQQAQNLALAELLGQYNGQQTLAARTSAEQLALQQQQQQQNLSLAIAELTGQYGNTQTLGARQLAAQTDAQKFAQLLAAGELTGQFNGQQTLGSQQLALQGRQLDAQTQAQKDAQAIALAEILGQYNGQQTLASQAQSNAQRLSEGQLTGYYNGQRTIDMQQLVNQANQFEQQLNAQAAQENARLQLAAGELTGQYKGSTTLGAQQLAANNAQNNIANQLAAAQLTGQYNGQQTLAGQQLASTLDPNSFVNQVALAELLGTYNGQQTLGGQSLALQQGQIETDNLGQLVASLIAAKDAGLPVADSRVSDAFLQLIDKLGGTSYTPPPSPTPPPGSYGEGTESGSGQYSPGPLGSGDKLPSGVGGPIDIGLNDISILPPGRAKDLLTKSINGTITPDEQAELNAIFAKLS